MGVFGKAKRLARRVLTEGPVATAQLVIDVGNEIVREGRLGIATRAYDMNGLRDDVNHGYQPVAYHLIDIALAHIDITPRDVFIDYGSGKGRVVAVAATKPFRRVIGVEFDAVLHEAAQRNIAAARRRLRCTDVVLLHVDATTFAVPDDVSVIFMFNPFRGDVMKSVQERIVESLRRASRKLTLVYVYPEDIGDLFAECPLLTHDTLLPTGAWDTMRMAIYRSDAH
jgi:tRNA A58 N-methylase Trm61